MQDLKKGFTLIEILIVLSIIGLLSSLLIPNIAGAQLKAKEAGVKAALHNLQTGLETYNIDYFVYPPGNNITAAELSQLLIQKDYLKKAPLNPFTGYAYGAEDSAGKIIYSFDNANTYTLTGYKADGQSILLELTNM